MELNMNLSFENKIVPSICRCDNDIATETP